MIQNFLLEWKLIMLKPKKLNKGETVAFISPSSAHSSLFPLRLERARNFFIRRGYNVKLGKTTTLNIEGRAGTIEERIADITEQFRDPQVRAIIASSGGLFCNELLAHLDYKLISQNPKIFCGYSDNTLLSAAFLKKAGLTSFYGPCVIPEFGEYPQPFEFTVRNFFRALEGNLDKILPAESGTDEFVDWFVKEEHTRPLLPKKKYEWIIPGQATGRIIGGCLPSLQQLAGTEYDFDYEGAILFLDIPEGDQIGKGMTPQRVDSLMTDLELTGKLQKSRAIILGRLFRQTPENELRIKEIAYQHARKYNLPLMYGVDLTHADPKVTIPLGVLTRLDSKYDDFKVLEQGVVK